MSLSSISLLDCCALGWQFPKATFKFSVNCSLCNVCFWESDFQRGSSLYLSRCTAQECRSHVRMPTKWKDLYRTTGTLSEFLHCFYVVLLPDKNRAFFFLCCPNTSWSDLLYNMRKRSRTTPFNISNLSNTHISVTYGSKGFLLWNARLVLIDISMGNILLFY